MKMKTYFLKTIQRSPSVCSFRLSRPPELSFRPGQFLRMVFDEDNTKNTDLNKYLSFSAGPDNPFIEVTKRISSSAFSRKLLDLRENDEVCIEAPLGNCFFSEHYKKICFLTGGIGITPVISILEYITKNNLDTSVFLLYSNRTDHDIAFKDILDTWREHTPEIKVIYTISDCKPQNSECLSGRINKEMLIGKVPDICRRELFIYGPPTMVSGMKNLCEQLDCPPEKIHAENFTGY